MQKEGCGRARGPPALRKLGQSRRRLVTSLLMEAASSVWIFLYCRRQCEETSWLLRISVLIIWPEISLFHPGIGSAAPVQPSEYRPFSPKASGHPSPTAPCPTLKHTWTHFLPCLLNLEWVHRALLSIYIRGCIECDLGQSSEERTTTDCLSSNLPLPLTCCMHDFEQVILILCSSLNFIMGLINNIIKRVNAGYYGAWNRAWHFAGNKKYLLSTC